MFQHARAFNRGLAVGGSLTGLYDYGKRAYGLIPNVTRAYSAFRGYNPPVVVKRRKGRGRRYGKLRLGQRHMHVYQNASGFLNSTALYESKNLTGEVDLGDKFDQRNSNNIFNHYICVKINANNTHTKPRYLRCLIVSLRGSSAAGDVSTWSDLLINSDYTKSAPTGLAETMLYRINKDEYKVYMDRTMKIGTDANSSTSRQVKFLVKPKCVTQYAYNSSTDIRRNPIYIIFLISEVEGEAANAANLNYTYQVIHSYSDVDSFKG